jgi:hypothetical protein
MLPYGIWPSNMYASLPEKDKGNVRVGLQVSGYGGKFAYDWAICAAGFVVQ